MPNQKILQIFSSAFDGDERSVSALSFTTLREGFQVYASSSSGRVIDIFKRRRDIISMNEAAKLIASEDIIIEFFGLSSLMMQLSSNSRHLTHILMSDTVKDKVNKKMHGKWPAYSAFSCVCPDLLDVWSDELEVRKESIHLIPLSVDKVFEADNVSINRMISINNILQTAEHSYQQRVLFDCIDVDTSKVIALVNVASKVYDSLGDLSPVFIFNCSADKRNIEAKLSTIGIKDACRVLHNFEDRPALIKSVDLLVVLESNQGINQGILEGIASGRRVIAPNNIWNNFTLSGGAGILIDDHDSNRIAEAIIENLKDSGRGEMEKKAFKKYKENFRFDVVQKKSLKTLQSLYSS